MAKNNIYVLDTSAIFCLKDNEDGAAKVEKILEAAKFGHSKALISFISLMEYLYVTMLRLGDEIARKTYLELTLLPLMVIESDEDLRLAAAEFKANYNLSVTDAWVAATAKVNGATLVHKDPEFDALRHSLACISLPYKS